MGGGASAGTVSLEDLIATTCMIGRVFARQCPAMYRIYDFHSPLAPKLRNAQQSFSFAFFAADDDLDDDDPTLLLNEDIDPAMYSDFFCIKIGEDVIYLEDPMLINEAGWNALHTCCMSFVTVQAGFDLIKETLRVGGDLNAKTISGPGSFNSGWSALHMASAYGVEPLVDALIRAGADVNSRNSHGHTSLLEACRRGYIQIVSFLVQGGADLLYMPSEQDACSSPFATSPPHCALGEGSRCGFQRIVQLLLDAGANRDQCNALGWTSLHEACFYNRIETVQVLLLAGANPTLRTRRGALPYHLAGLQIIRTMLKEMGGEGAVPADGDVIDTMAILRELTGSDDLLAVGDEDCDDMQFIFHSDGGAAFMDASNVVATYDSSIRGEGSSVGLKNIVKTYDDGDANIDTVDDKEYAQNGGNRSNSSKDVPVDKLLHSGRLLGDLPSLNKTSPTKSEFDNPSFKALENPDRLMKPLSMKADSKANSKKKKSSGDEVPVDMPREYLCQLTQRPMSEPVKSIYGHLYEKSSILSWIKQQGHICPLSGAPLAEINLKPFPELGDKIRAWILHRSAQTAATGSSSIQAAVTSSITFGSSTDSSVDQLNKTLETKDDDLYDF